MRCSRARGRLAPAALCLVLLPALGAAGAASSPPLAWRDGSGRPFGPRELASLPAVVLVFGSTTCPCADRYTGRVAELAAALAPRGVRFFQVFSARGVPAAEVSRYAAQRKLTVPVVHDADGRLARRLGVRATPTAVVLDRRGAVRYRGRIDDNPDPQAAVRQELREAVESLLAGRPVRAAAPAVGCTLAKQAGEAPGGPPKLEPGLGPVHLPVTTASPVAQRYFDQGLNRWFGFNLLEAEASFREAARLDPSCAMAHWGAALSLGMNYNYDFDPKRLPEAEAAAARAVARCRAATPKEQELIRALALRHAPGREMKEQLRPYQEAMARVYYLHPDDATVAVLYAASLMDLNPWALWTADGRPAPGTLEAVLVLEAALRRAPNHIGACHYYIHATEASPQPERALVAAGRLAAHAPRSGHLVHMPSHTYFRVGAYRESVEANRTAAAADARYFQARGRPASYGLYYAHNLDFIVAGLMFEGRGREAVEAARELARESARWFPDMGGMLCGPSGLMTVYARFGRWDEILRAPAPAGDDPFAHAAWRHARGLARAAGRDTAAAEQELAALSALERPLRERALAVNPTPEFAEVPIRAHRTARLHLAARIAAAKGDPAEAERQYRAAMEAEDSLPYTEPPPWRLPIREGLGALLLARGRAAEAEKLFREELRIHPRSGRALFGLRVALERQGKEAGARQVGRQFDAAWARADTRLRLEAL